MPKHKTVSDDELVKEFERIFERWQKGEINDEEFWKWWRSHIGIKGKGILASFFKQRELLRGWDKKQRK
ncbi:MAG: hypothetical protein NZ805_09250 [Armatimonadetes bacterium]|nr:hypothetical protein [Armatimonadota bacterium]